MIKFFERLLARLEGRVRSAEARVLESIVADFTKVETSLRNHAEYLRQRANADYQQAEALRQMAADRINQAIKAAQIAGNIAAIVNPAPNTPANGSN